MPLENGRRLGPYEILSPLGAGGMGEVYEARDTRLGRPVAIKVLPEPVASDPERVRRMEEEARAVAALDHPHILTVHDVGREEEIFFIVYELLQGETLRKRLGRGPLSLRAAASFGAQIAGALAAAHEKGIVHRDVKPENLFVTGDERVKLLDFGLARHEPVAEDESSARTLTRLTELGAVIGTSGYMAPEQARGEPLDLRADLFSLGAVLFEMITGERAFQGPTAADTLSAILREDARRVSELVPDAPGPLTRIVSRCLAKSPGARFQSAPDLEFALRELALSESGPVDEPSSGSPQRAIRFEVPPPEGAMLTGQLALAPDGSHLAFVATTNDGQDLLFVRPLDAVEPRGVPRTEGAAFPFWSPDSRSIGFFADGQLKRVDPFGIHSPRSLCRAYLPRGGAWSPDGTIVFAVAAGGEVRTVPATGGDPRPVDHLVSRKGELFRWPSFLPDGDRLLCFVLSDDAEMQGLHLTSLGSGSTRRVAKADWGGLYAPSGMILFRVGDRLMAQPFDAESGQTTGPARPLVENVWWDGISTLLTACTVSRNGLLAYQTGGLANSELVWHDRSGSRIGVAGPRGAYLEPELSPDGLRIAVAAIEPGKYRLLLIDAERGALFPLDTGIEGGFTPLWSPDGRQIAYSRFPSGEVMVARSSGGAAPEPLFDPGAFSPLGDWSRDGRFVVHDHADLQTYRWEIHLRDLERDESRPLVSASFSNAFARLSPDGRMLAYQSEASGSPEIVIQDFPELQGRIQVSVGGGTQPRWRDDGRELYYVSTDRRIMAVEVEAGGPLRVGPPRSLFQTRILPLVEARNHYDVTRDGERFLVNSRLAEDASLEMSVIVDWPATLSG